MLLVMGKLLSIKDAIDSSQTLTNQTKIAQSYQLNRKMSNKKNLMERSYFQKVEQENLEKKKRLTQSKML